MKRMHSKRHLSYDDQTTGPVWTLCFRHAPQDQIAAFREGVTCKNCVKALEWSDEAAQWSREYRERHAAMEAK